MITPPSTIEGFVHRPDGYWFQTTDGTLHSVCPVRGRYMVDHLRRASQDMDVPYLKEDIMYLLSSIRYRITVKIVILFDRINKFLRIKK